MLMQRGTHQGSPAPASWLGMSPPTRTTGAVNPLVQDFNWRSNAYRCTLVPAGTVLLQPFADLKATRHDDILANGRLCFQAGLPRKEFHALSEARAMKLMLHEPACCLELMNMNLRS